MSGRRRYDTAFLQHLSLFDRDGDGLITFAESLRGNLSLGLNFPVSLAMSIGQQVVYGNAGTLHLTIDISRVKSRRTMLSDMNTEPPSARKEHDEGALATGHSRTMLLDHCRSGTLLDRIHVRGLWALAADASGIVSAEDVRDYQQGSLLWRLEARRKFRDAQDSNVLSFFRGGPGSVAGHSWFVKRLFDVDVYQNP